MALRHISIQLQANSKFFWDLLVNKCFGNRLSFFDNYWQNLMKKRRVSEGRDTLKTTEGCPCKPRAEGHRASNNIWWSCYKLQKQKKSRFWSLWMALSSKIGQTWQKKAKIGKFGLKTVLFFEGHHVDRFHLWTSVPEKWWWFEI